MPKWLSYLMLIPGVVIAIPIAFGWEEGTLENIGLSGMFVVVGMALMGMSQAERLHASENREEARRAEIHFAFVRMAATALITLAMLGFTFYVMNTTGSSSRSALFWFSLPFFFILLTIKYYQVWRIIRFLHGSGRVAEGEITGVETQIHHRQGIVYQKILYRFEVSEMGSFSGESVVPHSPYVVYEIGGKAQVLYDPAKPARNLLLNSWHGKGLHSKREYDKKLACPDEGDA